MAHKTKSRMLDHYASDVCRDGYLAAADDDAVSEYRIPKTFAERSRLEQQLILFVVSATDPLSGIPKPSLETYVAEAQLAIQTLKKVSTAADDADRSPSKPASAPLASVKRSKLAPALTTQAARSSADPSVSAAVRYLVAACRAPLSQAVPLLERASAEGSLCASVELGVCLAFGIGCAASPGVGLELLDSAVQVLHPGAMHAVARCLREGIGVPVDTRSSWTWLQRAAEANFVVAQHECGEVFEDGSETLHVDRSLPLSLRWYKRAAMLGYAASQLNLAKLMFVASQVDVGSIATIDPRAVPSWQELRTKALFWLNAAASRGNPEARQLVERVEQCTW